MIALREKHIPKGAHEQNIVCDLNDHSWVDKISFDPTDGVVFTAGACFTTLRQRYGGAVPWAEMAETEIEEKFLSDIDKNAEQVRAHGETHRQAGQGAHPAKTETEQAEERKKQAEDG